MLNLMERNLENYCKLIPDVNFVGIWLLDSIYVDLSIYRILSSDYNLVLQVMEHVMGNKSCFHTY